MAGYIDGIDDPGMGWARYAQTVRIFVLNSGLFYIQPSERTVRLVKTRADVTRSERSTYASQLNLMDRITGYLKTVKAWDQTVRDLASAFGAPALRLTHAPARSEQVFNEMIWYPSHGSARNSQVSVRSLLSATRCGPTPEACALLPRYG